MKRVAFRIAGICGLLLAALATSICFAQVSDDRSLEQQAERLEDAGRVSEARDVWLAALKRVHERNGDRVHEASLRLHAAKTELVLARFAEAEKLLRGASGYDTGSSPSLYLMIQTHLSVSLWRQDRVAEGERIAHEALDFAKARWPEGSKEEGGLKHALALMEWTRGNLGEATRLTRDAITLLASNGAGAAAAKASGDLATVLSKRGKHREAASICANGLASLESTVGPLHSETIGLLLQCAMIQLPREPAEAENQIIRVLEFWRSQPANAESRIAGALRSLALAKWRMNQREEALVTNAEALRMARAANPREPALVAGILGYRASMLKTMRRKNEAIECATEAAAIWDGLGIEPSLRTIDIRSLRGR